MDLNQMEANDPQGDTDDLWVTLHSMGFANDLKLDEVWISRLIEKGLKVADQSDTTCLAKYLGEEPAQESACTQRLVMCTTLASPNGCTLWRSGGEDLWRRVSVE